MGRGGGRRGRNIICASDRNAKQRRALCTGELLWFNLHLFVQMARASVGTCLVFSMDLFLADFRPNEIWQENTSAYIGLDCGFGVVLSLRPAQEQPLEKN